MSNELSYRQMLKTELADRIGRNPAYSLRAMAKQVELSPSLLSRVCQGSKGLSLDSLFRVANALGFDGAKKEIFFTLWQIDNASTAEARIPLMEKLQALQPGIGSHYLSLDAFRVISDWYHLAIRELVGTKDFNPNPKAIAATLGISTLEAENAIDRLLRLEMLTRRPDGGLEKTEGHVLASSAMPNEALRKYHGQTLQKAIESLSRFSPQEKFVGSETFAFDDKQLPAANAILEECFTKLVKLASKGKSRRQVFHLGIQFFPLSKKGTQS